MKNICKKIVGTILSKDKYPLDALADVNVELGLIAYKSQGPYVPKEESSLYEICSKVIETSTGDGMKLTELNKKTRHILNGKIFSAKTKGKILEKLGYKVVVSLVPFVVEIGKPYVEEYIDNIEIREQIYELEENIERAKNKTKELKKEILENKIEASNII